MRPCPRRRPQFPRYTNNQKPLPPGSIAFVVLVFAPVHSSFGFVPAVVDRLVRVVVLIVAMFQDMSFPDVFIPHLRTHGNSFHIRR